VAFYIAYKVFERIVYTFVPRANPVIVEHSSKMLFYVVSVAGFYWVLSEDKQFLPPPLGDFNLIPI
jgi:hypothetical protein